jgi:glycosyltransferase involved in cell wall biosynthesis
VSRRAAHLDPAAPLRIAYLTYRGKPHVGGQGIYTRHLTKALIELGHDVEVFSGQPYPILDGRAPLHELPSLDIFNDVHPGRVPGFWEVKTREDLLEIGQYFTGTFSEPLAFSYRARRALTPRAGEFDIVHDNQCLGYGILQLEKLIPTIVTLHHPITKDRRLEMDHATSRFRRMSVGRWYAFVKMQGRVASRMPRIVVVSENSIRDIHDDMGVSYDRMRLVPVGVDPDLFRPLPHVDREPGRLITTASADVALKGLPFLLEAVAKLRTERDVRLTVIGRPKPGKSLQLIETLGLAPYVDFVSGVTDEEIVGLYARAELAVVPSLYEGFSLPAIEAMATGTTLVATDGGALPEVTGRDGETVLSCAAGDAGALADTIGRGLDDRELRRRVGLAGRHRVLERWTWRRCAELTVEQYREVLTMPANVEKLRRNGRLHVSGRADRRGHHHYGRLFRLHSSRNRTSSQRAGRPVRPTSE